PAYELLVYEHQKKLGRRSAGPVNAFYLVAYPQLLGMHVLLVNVVQHERVLILAAYAQCVVDLVAAVTEIGQCAVSVGQQFAQLTTLAPAADALVGLDGIAAGWTVVGGLDVAHGGLLQAV